MPLTLYYHPLSSYCHKVLVALYENGTAFEKRLVDLGNPAERAALQAIWPVGKFPVLRDTARNRDVAESSIIIEYLDHHAPGARPLVPARWEDAMEVRQWDRVLDLYVHTPMQEIVLDRILGAGADLSRRRDMLDTAYAMLEAHLAGRTWMAGPGFSLADCAAAPALFYAGIVHPFAGRFTNLDAYFERLVERPSYRRVLDEARPFFSMFPFVDAMPKRFL